MKNLMQIIIQAKDQVTSTLSKVQKGLSGLSERSRQYQQTVRNLNSEANKLGQTLRSLVGIVGAAGMARSFVEINSSAEKTRIMLEGLIGSAEGASKAFDWILDFSTQVPFELGALQDSFVKLKSAGIDPMSGSMKALTDAVSAFGGSNQDLRLVTMAIQQMAGKGVVSMEELRQQIGERIPTAMQAMAEGLGMTMAQLTKEIQRGNITATEGINAMLSTFEEWYEGRGRAMMTSWAGLVSNLQVVWKKFTLAIGESRVFEKLKTVIDGVLKKLNEMKKNGALKAWAERISETVSRLIDVFTVLAGTFLKIADALGPALPVLAEVVIYFKLIKATLGGLINLPLSLAENMGQLSFTLKSIPGTGITKYLKNMGTVLGVLPSLIAQVGTAFFAGWQFGKLIRKLDVFGLSIGEWAEVAMAYLDKFFTWLSIRWLESWRLAKKVFSLNMADTSGIERQIAALQKHQQIMTAVIKDIKKGSKAETEQQKAIEGTTAAIKKQTKSRQKQKISYEDMLKSVEKGSAQWISLKNQELKTLKAQTDYEIALDEKRYKEGNISLENFLKTRKDKLQRYVSEVISLKEMELASLKKTPEPDLEKIKVLEEEIKQLKIQAAGDQLKIDADLKAGLRKQEEDYLSSWRVLQELRLQSLKGRMDLEDALERQAVESGEMRESQYLSRSLSRLERYYEERIRLKEEELQKVADVKGTESEEYQKLYAERKALQNEIEIKIMESEANISRIRKDEESSSLKYVAELTDDRVKLAKIEADEKRRQLKRYLEQGLISYREYSDAVNQIEKELTGKINTEINQRSKQLNQWVDIIHQRVRRMWDSVKGIFQTSYEDIKLYFGGAAGALKITIDEIKEQISGFLKAINSGTYETFWKAELFGRRMTEMVGTSIYEWAQRVTEYVQYIKGLMASLKDTIQSYEEQLLRMEGKQMELVRLWYEREIQKLKEKYKDLEETPEYRKAFSLLKKLYEEKLKKAREAMEKEKELWAASEKAASASSERITQAIKKGISPLKNVNKIDFQTMRENVLSNLMEPLGQIKQRLKELDLGTKTSVDIKKEMKLDTSFVIKTLDPDQTRRWIQDYFLPEFFKAMRLRGMQF